MLNQFAQRVQRDQHGGLHPAVGLREDGRVHGAVVVSGDREPAPVHPLLPGQVVECRPGVGDAVAHRCPVPLVADRVERPGETLLRQYGHDAAVGQLDRLGQELAAVRAGVTRLEPVQVQHTGEPMTVPATAVRPHHEGGHRGLSGYRDPHRLDLHPVAFLPAPAGRRKHGPGHQRGAGDHRRDPSRCLHGMPPSVFNCCSKLTL